MKKLLPLVVFVCLSMACIFIGTEPTPPPHTATPIASPTRAPSATEAPAPTLATTAVPPPTGEDIVRLFFALIDEDRIPEAVAMLDSSAAPDDAARQDWGVTFNRMQSITITDLRAWDDGTWTDTQEIYRVTLDVRLKTGEVDAGWLDGENTRWVTLTLNQASGLWQVHSLSTGP